MWGMEGWVELVVVAVEVEKLVVEKVVREEIFSLEDKGKRSFHCR